MKQKGCALARVEDVALQPCSARKVFKPLMIEGLGELTWACPLYSVNSSKNLDACTFLFRTFRHVSKYSSFFALVIPT